MPLAEVVEMFVRHLKHKAEAFAGQGRSRPSYWAGRCASSTMTTRRMRGRRGAPQAIAGRRAFATSPSCTRPIAAARHYERTVPREELALIADIGGGTSDFTIVRLGRRHGEGADRAGDVLASAGVHVGGTDFDSALSLAAMMPLLGLGTRSSKRTCRCERAAC